MFFFFFIKQTTKYKTFFPNGQFVSDTDVMALFKNEPIMKANGQIIRKWLADETEVKNGKIADAEKLEDISGIFPLVTRNSTIFYPGIVPLQLNCQTVWPRTKDVFKWQTILFAYLLLCAVDLTVLFCIFLCVCVCVCARVHARVCQYVDFTTCK